MTRDAMEQRLDELEAENAQLSSDLTVVKAHRDRLLKEMDQLRAMLSASGGAEKVVNRG